MIYFKFMKNFLIVTPTIITAFAINSLVNHGRFDTKYAYHPYKVVLVSLDFFIDFFSHEKR